MMKFRLLVALVCLFQAFSTWANDSFIVKDIRVEGIQRTEAGTVFSYLPVKVGDLMNEEKATGNKALKYRVLQGCCLKNEHDVLIVK